MTGPLFTVIGAALIAAGVLYRFAHIPGIKRKIARRTAGAKGVITNVRTYARKNSPTGYECDFSYSVGGREYSINSVRAYIPHEKGEPVNVLYNPEKPEDAHVEGFFSDPGNGKKAFYFLVIAGAASAVFGVVTLIAG